MNEMTLHYPATNLTATDLGITADVLAKRASGFGCKNVNVTIDNNNSTITLHYPEKDSLEKYSSLFTTKGELKFLPVCTQGLMQENEAGQSYLEQWNEAGILISDNQPAVILKIPVGATDMLNEIMNQNNEQDMFILTEESRITDGTVTIYPLVNDNDPLTGKNVSSASCEDNAVMLTFDDEGKTKFAALTKAQTGNCIAIIVDNKVLSAPVVRDEIQGGKAMISGNFTKEEAGILAAVIGGGQIPVELTAE